MGVTTHIQDLVAACAIPVSIFLMVASGKDIFIPTDSIQVANKYASSLENNLSRQESKPETRANRGQACGLLSVNPYQLDH